MAISYTVVYIVAAARLPFLCFYIIYCIPMQNSARKIKIFEMAVGE